MSSTRSSSPSEHSASEKYTSPKSKIRALLATVGSDSEEDSPNSASKPSERSQIDNDADTSEDDIVRPRGRFAARMMDSIESATDNTVRTETNTEGAPESARDRVRRLLRLDASNSQDPDTQEQAAAKDTEGDDEVLPATPRRRKHTARVSAPSTPSTPGLASHAPALSPGLFVSPGPSPGLFVSPGQKSAAGDDFMPEDDNDTALPKLKNSRFQALIDRKRREKEAREAEEEAKRAARPAFIYDDDEGDLSGITDDEAGRKLTQQTRPQRKAGKKAIEEMNRETQRMARRMQLKHQAMTKKKITKATLFEKFGFRPAGAAAAAPVAEESKLGSSSRPTSPTSDAEMGEVETPPSSPPTTTTEKADQTLETEVVPEEDFAPFDQIPASSPREAKAKDAAVGVDTPAMDPEAAGTIQPKRRVRVKLPPPTVSLAALDSDDDLRIAAPKNSKLDALFNRIPNNKNEEPGALKVFRCLAQVSSPGKKPHGKKTSSGMTAAEMQAMLRERAREQARVEKERRIEMLKAKGIVIQTEEERRKEIEEVEDIVSRAREEAEEIMQRERSEAKQERKERAKNGEVDPLGWDDSEDDEDFEVSAGEEGDDEDEREIELSGSEDEDNADGSEDEAANPLFENEADEDGSESSDVDKEMETVDEPAADQMDDVDDDQSTPLPRVRRAKNTRVLSDDEDEDVAIEATPKPKPGFFKSPAAPGTDSPAAPTSVLRSARKTFIPGLPIAPSKPAGLGLTQMFAGTMDDSSQMDMPTQSMDSPRPTFDPFAGPAFAKSQDMEDDDDVIMDSQPLQETQGVSQGGVNLHYSQTQMRGLDSLAREDTQLSDFIPLTQDYGLEEHTPLRERFVDAPTSTIATVSAGGPTQVVHESPLIRRGRLRRKMDVDPVPAAADQASKEGEQDESRASPERDEFGFNTTSAFDAMKKAAKHEDRVKRQKEFDRKRSKANEMVDEQAAESEDEYAGLGGADDDDESDSDLGSVKDLIDDEKKENTAEDERKLAAFYADRERVDAEREVNKLFKDITTGALRRKRANDYDLSDSDDGGEARKRRKRMQFAKMQKALFADERVKKMSEKPGNEAFLRTLEDRMSGDEMDFIDIIDDGESEEESSQSQSQPRSRSRSQDRQGQAEVLVPNSQPTTTTDRPSANMRRTKGGRKPSNIGDIRQSLSTLLDEPASSVIAPTEIDSESEDDEFRSNKENVSPRRHSGAVQDRISSRRTSSSGSSVNGRHAFAMGSTQQGFKAPTLLRRATSNSLVSNLTSTSGGSGDGAGADGGMFGDKIKKAVGRGSGVAFGGAEPKGSSFGRKAAETGAGAEAKRKERKMKDVEARLKAARGLFGGVAFE
ncbi:related to MRC1 - Mediator of the Replication Checkpoint [Cephalotrichum gorgonifer]|uniref:Related to MRC1 - Mediator of the Replication Checkpoint n=1 Tax=Cephalotrichum gorgonifer TaxID=2041049 RepID=A0AAE8N5G2_9PEZI|nr:related to MRC1 - Mediator of the Replication Checkpoint [Cephalotrichum gorgonifer]